MQVKNHPLSYSWGKISELFKPDPFEDKGTFHLSSCPCNSRTVPELQNGPLSCFYEMYLVYLIYKHIVIVYIYTIIIRKQVKIYKNYLLINEKVGANMRLEVKNLHKSFAGKEVLHGISFKVESGKALGLLGRNGAGKTTTIRIIMNLFNPDNGEILLNGEKFNPKNHQIGYLPEERGLYPKKKVFEQLVYLGQLRGLSSRESKENTLYWLKRLGVEEYRDKKLETLSKGNQQKVQLAETFLCNPDLIILDEPFSGLDPVNSQILKDIIIEYISKEKLLIFSSHQRGYVEVFCEESALIDKGNVVLTGNLNDIKTEYGKNRLTISLLGKSPEEVSDIFKLNLNTRAQVIEVRKDYIIIELLPGISKNDLLKDLTEINLDIEGFSIYKPSLADIFVEKVGEN